LRRTIITIHFAAESVTWNEWRAEFPILARRVYLNSCSLGALSKHALRRVATFHEQWHDYGAAAWYEPWLAAIAGLRMRVASMVNARPSEIALTASTSVALTSIASAVDYRERPRVVVSALDFPTLAYQWMVRPGVEVVRVPSDDGATVDPARFAEAVDERTAFLATSHVFFTTGAIQDLRALADIAHARGALFLVDAYQSVGQVPVDVRAADVDVLTTGPLKWLLGGPGLAYLYVRDELIRRLTPQVAGWFGAQYQFAFDISEFEFQDDARRFELGTPALPTVHSALGGQEIIDQIGVPRIRERNRALTERLIAAARERGYNVRCAATEAARSAIVMVEHPDPATAVGLLAAKNIIVDHRPGYVRISPHFYNTEEEIDFAIATLAAVK
jgi:selenocysteine lyase/cysteine desulfurase